MDGKSFRVLLDVTDLYLENLKYVWINVSPRELKTIYDFKKYLLRKICLEREDIQLFVRDGLLLDEETIVVLREDDTVKIKYKDPLFSNLVKDYLKEKAKSSRKRNINESNINDEEINSKRYNKQEYITLSSDENESNSDDLKSKKKKRRKQTESEQNSENGVSNLVEKKRKDKELTVNSNNSHKELTENLENSHSTLTKKKKKQTESSVNFEKFHSVLVDENHHKKKNHKKKNTNKSSIRLDQTVTDINFCKDNDVFLSFNSESTSQKQNKNSVSSNTTHLDSENMILLNNDTSSKEEFNYNQNKSSEVIIDLNAGGLSGNNELKKKRKRRKRRKQITAVFNLSDGFDTMNNFKSFSENAVENVNKHIVYLSPEKNQECNYLGTCELQNPTTDTFVLKDDKSNDIQSLDYPKMSTPAQANNYSDPDFQISLMPSKNSNLSNSENGSISYDKSTTKNTSENNIENKSEKLYEDLPDMTSLPVVGTYIAYKNLSNSKNGSISYDKSTTKSTSENNIENKSEKLYEDLPDLTSLPVVGTYIAYKTLELGEDYSPTVSDYRVGIVEKTNPETDEIEIKLNQEIILPGRTGKFENLSKDETPESIVKRYDVLNWCDIISPKLFNSLPE